jgi:hypothetical protein
MYRIILALILIGRGHHGSAASGVAVIGVAVMGVAIMGVAAILDGLCT